MTHGTHASVLLEAAVAALAIRPEGCYVDATYGRGGHSRAILAALGPHGRLYALDRDPQAAASAQCIEDPRFVFFHAPFSEAGERLDRAGVVALDGALLDLGVSSPQIDDAGRGFSFRFDGPLDMRMDTTRGESAAQWIARVDVDELTRVLRDYGEERLARSIAAAIVAARAQQALVSTGQLASVVRQAVGARTRGDWHQDAATRTFQAIRIAVNEEMHELQRVLPELASRLASGGRIAVISFHSLEDRAVKRFFATHSTAFGGDVRLARLPIPAAKLPQPPLRIVGRAIRAGDDEVAANPRARSATLRVAERTEAAWS